jgi:predicted DNA-binding helix-hairpin-helix protein
MDKLQKLQHLTEKMHLEPAEDAGCPKLAAPSRKSEKIVLSQAVLPNGKRISLLKSLLTSACERNCYYCPFRAGRDFRRATFKPEEFAGIFMNLDRAGLAQGVFLSSGVVAGGVHTQEKLIDTAEILRLKKGYRGYIHLKIMPGAERAQVERAMQLADRLSVNLEAPNSHRLGLLAPGKMFVEELIRPLRWIDEIRRTLPSHSGWQGRWPSSTTQFVVGGAGESDLELITTSQHLYQHLGIGRVYYSRFNPVPDTPLENSPAASPQREHRLYQASFLLRDYGFEPEELRFDPEGNLPLDIDPKLAWAKDNLSHTPLEINRASRHELLRVPGIGPKSAQAIINIRRQQVLGDLSTLYKLGITASRAAPFIIMNGMRPEFQLTLF